MANIVAIIVAGGAGSRMGNDQSTPKQYMCINDVAIMDYTLNPFLQHSQIDEVICVIGDHHHSYYEECMRTSSCLNPPVIGGISRQKSVKNALDALAISENKPDIVLVHDAARPLIFMKLIDAVLEPLMSRSAKGASLSLKAVDTFRKGEDTDKGSIIAKEYVDRDSLYAMQTPQAFDFDVLYQCHNKTNRDDHTDDTSLLTEFGYNVELITGHKTNIKITTQDDIALVQAYMQLIETKNNDDNDEVTPPKDWARI